MASRISVYLCHWIRTFPCLRESDLNDKLLILDLDETLIYGTEKPLERPADFRAGRFHIYKRPHVDAFLVACHARFRIAVWTSASPLYAREVVGKLFPESLALEFVWASERCTQVFDAETTEYHWRKPMKKVRQRRYPLDSVIAIDDSPEKWRQSYGNLVRVAPFFGALDDDELPHLLDYLDKLRDAVDVRRIEKRGWRRSVKRTIEEPQYLTLTDQPYRPT